MDLDIVPEQEAYDPDPTLVSEYQEAIFAYKREMEIKMLPDPQYMSRQSDLTWHYRVQLIGWLIQVHERFDLLQETLHLCVNYLDRFLSKIVIPVDQLQLAGTVALLLASKYEEIQSPAIEELVFLGGNAYTAARIRQAEIGMLQSLAYDMGAPSPMSFLRRISRADDYDVDIRTLAKYLIDVTLCDHRFIGLPSSMIAAVGYCTSMRLLFRGEWTVIHEQYSGYTESALHAGINVLLTMLEQPDQTHQALFKKYQDERYLHSSTYVQGLGAQLHTFHC
ncbi:cyclin-like protein [Dissophora ornata]|nr:cyclin-like protein [Dissophora ornata]